MAWLYPVIQIEIVCPGCFAEIREDRTAKDDHDVDPVSGDPIFPVTCGCGEKFRVKGNHNDHAKEA